MADDPDISSGAKIAAGTKPAPTKPAPDPDIAVGNAIASAPPPVVSKPDTPPPTPSWTWGGVASNVGAGLEDAYAYGTNLLQNPSQAVLTPLAVAGGTAYDFAAPFLGLPRMTPEQRADLYGQPQPGQTQLPPEQQQPGTRLINVLDPSNANVPATPVERVIRAGTAGVGMGAGLGGGGILPAVAGGTGGVVGEVASQNVPDWLKPGAQLAGNVAGATAVGAGYQMTQPPVGLTNAGKAALADTAINKYKIPLEASDLTGDPRMARTGAASVAATEAKQDAWQGAVITEMGSDGNKFTPKLMTDTAARTGQVYDDIANRTTIGQRQTDNLVHNDLAAIEANLDSVEGITDSDRAAIKKRLGEIVDAVQPNGTIPGGAYKALTQTGSPLTRLENSNNSSLANVGSDIKDALKTAFNNSASPEDQVALAKNDYQYRIMKTAQDLVAQSTDGNIDPKQFMAKVAAASRRFDSPNGGIAYTGGGNVGELAKIGSMMDVSPNFAPKTSAAQKVLMLGGEAAATIGPAMLAHPLTAAIAPMATAAYWARAKYLPSDAARNVMIRNALNPPASPYSAVFPSAATGSNQLQQFPPPSQ